MTKARVGKKSAKSDGGPSPVESAHDALLIEAMTELSELLGAVLTDASPLNKAIADRKWAAEIAKEARDHVKEYGLVVPEELLAGIESRLTSRTFNDLELDDPAPVCGVPLYRYADHHGTDLKIPELLAVADLAFTIDVPEWVYGATNDKAKGVDGIAQVRTMATYSNRRKRVLVGVYPSGVPIARITKSLAELQRFSQLDKARTDYRPVPDQVIAVVDREDAFLALSTGWDVVLITEAKARYRIPHLMGLITVRRESFYFHTDRPPPKAG